MMITSLYAGLLALLFLVLSWRVVQKRMGRSGIGLGDGGDDEMTRRIRGHGNFAEYVPLQLILLGLLEYGGAMPAWLLHALGLTILVSRLLHGISMSFTQRWVFGRFWGTLLNFLLLLVLGLLCAWRGVAALLV